MSAYAANINHGPISYYTPNKVNLAIGQQEEQTKISARNEISGEIIEIKKGSTTAHVRIKANGIIITASITNESVDELGLKVGDSVQAVIKSSDVMIVVP